MKEQKQNEAKDSVNSSICFSSPMPTFFTSPASKKDKISPQIVSCSISTMLAKE
jgi:hypothetical protein